MTLTTMIGNLRSEAQAGAAEAAKWEEKVTARTSLTGHQTNQAFLKHAPASSSNKRGQAPATRHKEFDDEALRYTMAEVQRINAYAQSAASHSEDNLFSFSEICIAQEN